MARMAQGNRQYEQERRLISHSNDIEWVNRYYGHVLQQAEQQARRVVRGVEAPAQTDNELVDDLMSQLINTIAKVRK